MEEPENTRDYERIPQLSAENDLSFLLLLRQALRERQDGISVERQARLRRPLLSTGLADLR